MGRHYSGSNNKPFSKLKDIFCKFSKFTVFWIKSYFQNTFCELHLNTFELLVLRRCFSVSIISVIVYYILIIVFFNMHLSIFLNFLMELHRFICRVCHSVWIIRIVKSYRFFWRVGIYVLSCRINRINKTQAIMLVEHTVYAIFVNLTI